MAIFGISGLRERYCYITLYSFIVFECSEYFSFYIIKIFNLLKIFFSDFVLKSFMLQDLSFFVKCIDFPFSLAAWLKPCDYFWPMRYEWIWHVSLWNKVVRVWYPQTLSFCAPVTWEGIWWCCCGCQIKRHKQLRNAMFFPWDFPFLKGIPITFGS